VKKHGLLVFICFFLLANFFAHAQTTDIVGKVTSSAGEALPGAEVTLSSPNLIGGNQVKVTDTEGKFRFVALLPGTYTVEAKLPGFNPKMASDLRLSAGKTLTVDFVLEVGSLEAEMTVVAEAPIIDLKDSQTVTTSLKTEFLNKLPNRGVEGALDMTAGVSNLSAFGSAVSNSNNYLVNGVKVNDPEAGEMGMSPDYDSIEEISVGGVGAPAEYDGYSGAIVNTVMKSGGNTFSGLFTFFMRAPSFHSNNWGEYPYLVRKSFPESYEINFNLGGPIIKDKLWFFVSGGYDYGKDHIEDFTGLTESSNGQRVAGKLTWQAGKNARFAIWAAVEPSVINNYGTDPLYAPEANTNENHINYYFNSNNLHTLSSSTFFEWKIGGFLNKGENGVDRNGPPAHRELTTDVLSGSYPTTYYRTSLRIQTDVALTHHAEDFILGDHDFKFGAEVEISNVNISYFFPGNKYYLDYNAENYIMDVWDGEEGNPKSRTFSAFIQDTWSISDRLVINPGIRFNYWRGYVPGVSGPAFAPKSGIAPRIGLTFDLFGDNSTALKAHYGKYYHGIMGQFYFRLQPQGAFSEYLWEDDDWVLDFEDTWENEYTVDPNLKMPYMNQYVIGIERELGKNVSAGLSFIYRTNHDFQDRVNITGEWAETTWTCDLEGPDLGKTYTVYERLNPGENQYLLTNPQAGQDYGAAFPGIVPFTPSRKYRGLQFNFEKRWANRWMLNASYVWSKSWGTDDNDWGEWGENRGSMLGASTMYSNPNYQINAYGPLGIDPTHQIKVFGAVDIPVVDINLGISYGFATGNPYSSNVALPRDIDPDAVNGEDWVYIYGEARGTYRYPAMHSLSFRLEKFFRIGKTRVAALADVFNALNSDIVTSYRTDIRPGSSYPFGYVWRLQSPRTFRLGFRFEF
jgi:hypothetical protein